MLASLAAGDGLLLPDVNGVVRTSKGANTSAQAAGGSTNMTQQASPKDDFLRLLSTALAIRIRNGNKSLMSGTGRPVPGTVYSVGSLSPVYAVQLPHLLPTTPRLGAAALMSKVRTL